MRQRRAAPCCYFCYSEEEVSKRTVYTGLIERKGTSPAIREKFVCADCFYQGQAGVSYSHARILLKIRARDNIEGSGNAL